MNTPIHVLFIEDNPGDARLVQEQLRSTSAKSIIQLDWVDRLERGLQRLEANNITAILLDLNLSDSQGLDTLQRVLSRAPNTAVVVMTGHADEETGIHALQAGAQDYLIKGQVDGHLLTRSIQYAIQRKETEEALRESEERFRLVVQSAPSAMIVVDQAGNIALANRQAEELFGYSVNELLGQPVELLVPQRLRGAHADLHGDYLAQPQAIAIGLRRSLHGLHKNGHEIPLEIGLAPYQSSEGLLVLALINDVTERKRAEELSQRQLQRLSALRQIDLAISSSFDLHLILDIVLRQVLLQLGVDASAILLFNLQLKTLEQAASRGFRSRILQSTVLKLGEGYAGQAVLQRKTIRIANLSQRKDRFAKALQLAEEEFADYYAVPLTAKGEVKGVLEIYHRSPLQSDPEWLDFLETLAGQAAIAIDNAQLFENLQRSNLGLERRVAERTAELNKTNVELERANRTKDEFLANMSHELRTPLNSILGLSESLLEEERGPLNDYQQRSLQIIQSSGQHLLELITDVLDLSKIEAGMFDFYPQPVVVDELCRACLTLVKTQAAKKSIDITYMNEALVAKIIADPRRLKQILVNLLTNAVKFTLENGQVTLQVKSDVEEDLIQFSVIDNGIGIAPEDLHRLFQPFAQVDSRLNREYEGTGLGLALVQKLTDLHGGSVQVESEVGKGSCFTISLYCKQAEFQSLENSGSSPKRQVSKQAGQAEASTESTLGRGIVLLAEDRTPNILTIGDYLENHGYEVLTARDGLEAIEKAEALKPDIILMDIQMPVMDGLEAITRLRRNAEFAFTPIIALTALAMPGDRERCLQAGATEYMSKPVSLKTLRQTITNLLQTRHDG
jgi:PAS domain S-box-containing protein